MKEKGVIGVETSLTEEPLTTYFLQLLFYDNTLGSQKGRICGPREKQTGGVWLNRRDTVLKKRHP